MSPRRYYSLLLCGLLLAAVPGEAGVLDGNCRVANQPAASLLIPYFEVDLADPSGATTLVSINNASAKPALARVVLWTDWAVPTLAFDVYLTGYDVQTLNVRNLLEGNLPVTGPGTSHLGELSDPHATFSGCGGNATANLSTNPDNKQRNWLQAAHTGRAVAKAATEQCAGSGAAGPNVATGYITVDAVNRCSPRSVGTTANTPAQAGYFVKGGKGIASDANVLWGDYYYVNSRKNTADSQAAVSIVADPDHFKDGDYTFYGRYVNFNGSDDRIPLSSLYYVRYMNGGSFGSTDLVVWRDNRESAAALIPCGKKPAWSPLGEMQLVAFDEEENPSEITSGNAFPVTTQKVRVGTSTLSVSKPLGFLVIDLWHKDSTHAQGWVSVMMSAAKGRFSTGHEAVRVDDLCNFGL